MINAIRVWLATPFYYICLWSGLLCLKIWGNATWLLQIDDIRPERDSVEDDE